MRLPTLPSDLAVLLKQQDGAMTSAQAIAAGMTPRHLRTLVAAGWDHPHRGVYVTPHPQNALRASIRAAILASPQGNACGVTAARLHELWGLPVWTTDEEPSLILPTGLTHNPRAGMRLHNGLLPGEATIVHGLAATTLTRTVHDLARLLSTKELVCAVDSALAAGWVPVPGPRRGGRRLAKALALSDARSESALETLARLVLVAAGLPPEVLQLVLHGPRGQTFRYDMAWLSAKLIIELDGRAHHDDPEPLYRDREKANAALLAGWHVLRFTWWDITRRPEWVVETVRAALAARASTR